MKKQPLVSVYITTCNRVDLLDRAINSVLSQTYKNIELIISDDASTDGTQKYCEELVRKIDNIIYIRNDVSKGACFTRNRAINVASGDFITGLDDDDFFKKERVEYFVKNWKPKYSFIATRSKSLEQSFLSKILEMFTKSKVCTYKDFFVDNPFGNQIFTSSDMFKKNLFDVEFPALQDFELWFRISRLYGDFNVLKISTQVMDFSHVGPRITTLERRENALNILVNKYSLEPSSFDILRLGWKVEFREKLNFHDICKLLKNKQYKKTIQYFYYKFQKRS